MRILWHSVAPWFGSGYGQQTALFAPRLRALGHDVAISANAGLGGQVSQWNGITVFPSWDGAVFGHGMLAGHAARFFGPERDDSLVITLFDVWTLRNTGQLRSLPVASWTPVDHDPAPPPVVDWFKQSASIPIAMSRFGEAALRDGGLDPVYVPHGVDTKIFCPGERAAARERNGLPKDAFVIAIVAGNVSAPVCRKGLAEQFAAFAALRRRHNDAVLYVHSEQKPSRGIDLHAVVRAYDVPTNAVFWTDPYEYACGLLPTRMADIYRAADLYSNAAYGEGFGIGIIEAQACGVPVVVTDITAMPELCGAGWRVACQRWWHQSMASFHGIPLVSAITDAYLAAYDTRSDELRAKAREFALGYDADVVTERYWKPALDSIRQRHSERPKPA